MNVKLKNIASNIFSSSTLLYVGLILLAYLVSTGIMTKNRIYTDSVKRSEVHDNIIKESSWDYVASILWMNYSNKNKENSIISSQIVSAISREFGSDSLGLSINLDLAAKNGNSLITKMIRDIIEPYGDKIVMYRHGDTLFLLDDVSHDEHLVIYVDSNRFVRSDVASDILLNESPNFQTFQNYIYDLDKNCKINNFEEFKAKFDDGVYDASNLKGIMISASYINWKRGIFGDNITLSNGKVNPNVKQLIIASKINISETLMKNPLIVKHISDFSKNAVTIDRSFSANDKYNLIIMIGNLLMVIMVGLTIMIQYDLTNIKKATKRRRRLDDTMAAPPPS